jgi:hypothetical protein
MASRGRWRFDGRGRERIRAGHRGEPELETGAMLADCAVLEQHGPGRDHPHRQQQSARQR